MNSLNVSAYVFSGYTFKLVTIYYSGLYEKRGESGGREYGGIFVILGQDSRSPPTSLIRLKYCFFFNLASGGFLNLAFSTFWEENMHKIPRNFDFGL